ncbi:hypothetical protein DsansV1_C07g0077071 [Dioscorea sansibarensis]
MGHVGATSSDFDALGTLNIETKATLSTLHTPPPCMMERYLAWLRLVMSFHFIFYHMTPKYLAYSLLLPSTKLQI